MYGIIRTIYKSHNSYSDDGRMLLFSSFFFLHTISFIVSDDVLSLFYDYDDYDITSVFIVYLRYLRVFYK